MAALRQTRQTPEHTLVTVIDIFLFHPTHHDPSQNLPGSIRRAGKTAAQSTIFWIPQNVEPEKPVSEWKPMTFAQFHAEVSVAKQFYESQGTKLGIPKGSVIGIWLSGNLHTDPIQTFGLSAAGFTVQVFSLYYSHSPVVFELLMNTGAKALVVDSRLPGMPDLSACPVAVVDLARDIVTSEVSPQSLAPRPYTELKDDIAFIFHSSGSTARIPKVIPRSHSDITSVGMKFAFFEVAVKVGNFNHSAAHLQLLAIMFNGGSILIPSSLAFSVDELRNMIRACGLTTLTRLTPLLVPLLEMAQTDSSVLSMIKSFREIMCAGTPFPPDLGVWCKSEGLPITNIFGSSECGTLMISTPFGNPALLKPPPGLLYKLLPYKRDEDEAKLLELMLPAGSSALPHSSLRAPDGNFYVGDLFEPVEDGYYMYRGRKNDWIMTGVGHICDTKSIDDAVKQSCKDIVLDCVAVGSGRPSPALLVEPTEHADRDTIPRIIVERLATFSKSRFPHERLDDPRLVLVVNPGALPRTAAKGNIRRQGSEELFLKELNEMYGVLEPFKPGVY